MYVLSSSGADELSFGGGGSLEHPEPSLFTGAIVETLRTGSAGGSEGSSVTVDDLFDAVSERLARSTQTPVKSALWVDGRMVLADRPRGRPPELRPRPVRPADSPKKPDLPAPGWQDLLGYWHDVVQEEASLPFLPVRGGQYTSLTGAERLLSGDVDDEGMSVPANAEALVRQAVENGDQLWTGWPAVVATRAGRRDFAPLLVRSVEAIEEGGRTVLRPTGVVRPHRPLIRRLLDDQQADLLMTTYQPSWHAGERERLARDATHLLKSELDMTIVEELRPGDLSEQTPRASPGDGAYNVAVLFISKTDVMDRKLLKDLIEIGGVPERITGTALAALLPSSNTSAARAADEDVVAVTPQPANAAQLHILDSAMRHRLTVATGPPGTGKSQLIVNVVATALAAGQKVLVASTNGGAVDEVWQRCRSVQRGCVVRTGAATTADDEIADLRAALASVSAAPPNLSTTSTQHRLAVEDLRTVRAELADVGRTEALLASLTKKRSHAAVRLGVDPDWRPGAAAGGARSIATAPNWLFGEWRRTRLLRRVGLTASYTDTAAACAALADFVDADNEWRRLRDSPPASCNDDDLAERREQAQDQMVKTSQTRMRETVRASAAAGAGSVQALLRAKIAKEKDWKPLLAAMKYVRGWAVTCQSAGRFPCKAGMFDLVIVDEASQCPTAHVVPLLFRARRALVIGDAMQLTHITSLSAQRDRDLRERHGVPTLWCDEHALSARAYSAFHAAERAAGSSMLLNEHYRCHPRIATLANNLFYGGDLEVLTDTRRHTLRDPQAVYWWDCTGEAERSTSGRSWMNLAEGKRVVECVDRLLMKLPDGADIGVVTPYKSQALLIERLLGNRVGPRVRVGTVHTFQGGERDVMVFSLVAAPNVQSSSFNWFDTQLRLWNVAITRARSRIVVIGDRELWRNRGGIGGNLLEVAEAGKPLQAPDDAVKDRLYRVLRQEDPDVQLDVEVNGHRADALLSGGEAVVLDRSVPAGSDYAAHMERMLRRRQLLTSEDGQPARRVPRWTLDNHSR